MTKPKKQKIYEGYISIQDNPHIIGTTIDTKVPFNPNVPIYKSPNSARMMCENKPFTAKFIIDDVVGAVKYFTHFRLRLWDNRHPYLQTLSYSTSSKTLDIKPRDLIEALSKQTVYQSVVDGEIVTILEGDWVFKVPVHTWSATLMAV